MERFASLNLDKIDLLEYFFNFWVDHKTDIQLEKWFSLVLMIFSSSNIIKARLNNFRYPISCVCIFTFYCAPYYEGRKIHLGQIWKHLDKLYPRPTKHQQREWRMFEYPFELKLHFLLFHNWFHYFDSQCPLKSSFGNWMLVRWNIWN